MAYATLSHVESLDSALTFTANSKPSTQDVVSFLEETALELNGVLAARDYVTPVPSSATAAFGLLRRYNAVGANALAQTAHPDSPKAEAAERAWNRALRMLREGEVELPDAPRNSGMLAPRIRSGGANASATPFFVRDMAL